MRTLRRSAVGPVLTLVLAGCAALAPDPGREIQRGTLRGRPIDAALIHRLALEGDDASLALLARWLRPPALRDDAARRLVRLRIARSPFPEVRDEAAAVEETVLRLGVNPVALSLHAPRAARLDLAVRELAVEQRWTSASLRVRAGDAPEGTSEVPLRGALHVELAGLSRPVTLCAPGGALDPTPCVAAADVRSGAAIARVEDGVLRLATSLDPGEVAAWTREASLSIPLRIGDGPAVVALAGALRLSPPAALVLSPRAPGASGPDLRVSAVRTGDRIELAVADAGVTYRALVERRDAGSVRIVSRGAAGAAGAAGASGSVGRSGTSGADASCPPFAAAAQPGGPGQAGGHGGAGGPGGPGGGGGTIEVVVSAPPELRADTLDLLRAVVASEGGAGGAGGAGGSGGAGGRGGDGGSGATCSGDDGAAVRLPEAPDGAAGPDGAGGPDGAAGPGGAPGAVRLRVSE